MTREPRITPEQFRAMMAAKSGRGRRDTSVAIPAPARPRYRAGEMNKLEQQYARHLDLLKAGGEVIAWQFEPLKLRIGPKCYYTPDFLVIVPATRFIEVHEVKGFWQEDARVKIKAAAERFPWFTFCGVQFRKRSWIYERFEGRAQ